MLIHPIKLKHSQSYILSGRKRERWELIKSLIIMRQNNVWVFRWCFPPHNRWHIVTNLWVAKYSLYTSTLFDTAPQLSSIDACSTSLMPHNVCWYSSSLCSMAYWHVLNLCLSWYMTLVVRLLLDCQVAHRLGTFDSIITRWPVVTISELWIRSSFTVGRSARLSW
jgi:hypothetical protein